MFSFLHLEPSSRASEAERGRKLLQGEPLQEPVGALHRPAGALSRRAEESFEKKIDIVLQLSQGHTHQCMREVSAAPTSVFMGFKRRRTLETFVCVPPASWSVLLAFGAKAHQGGRVAYLKGRVKDARGYFQTEAAFGRTLPPLGVGEVVEHMTQTWLSQVCWRERLVFLKRDCYLLTDSYLVIFIYA